mgnify:CR=1 FL=1
MSPESEQHEVTVVLDADSVAKAVRRLAHEILEAHPDPGDYALMGILSRGRPLADRLASEIQRLRGESPNVGSLSTVLYRDDLRSGRRLPKFGSGETHFDFDVTGIPVILVDDVFATGRTTRAALDEIIDYGRPSRIELACLVDRGVRELPIRPDYVGWTIGTKPEDHVTVHLMETDGEDAVLLAQQSTDDSDR